MLTVASGILIVGLLAVGTSQETRPISATSRGLIATALVLIFSASLGLVMVRRSNHPVTPPPPTTVNNEPAPTVLPIALEVKIPPQIAASTKISGSVRITVPDSISQLVAPEKGPILTADDGWKDFVPGELTFRDHRAEVGFQFVSPAQAVPGGAQVVRALKLHIHLVGKSTPDGKELNIDQDIAPVDVRLPAPPPSPAKPPAPPKPVPVKPVEKRPLVHRSHGSSRKSHLSSHGSVRIPIKHG